MPTRITRLSSVLSFVLAMSPPAHAAGVDIAWDRCAADGGVANAVLDCANPDAYRSAFLSFISDTPMPQFDHVDYVLDLQVDAPALPPFWNLLEWVDNRSGCNTGWDFCEGSHDRSACPTSLNAWVVRGPCGAVCEASATFRPGPGGPNRGRIIATIRTGCHSDTVTIRPNASYDIHALSFYSYDAIEAGGTCAGCATPVTFVLNQVTLFSLDTAIAPIVITGPGVSSNCITLNGGGGVPCGATRSKPSTWGTLKELYR